MTEPKDKPALEDLRADAKRVSEYCYKAFAPPADEADRVAMTCPGKNGGSPGATHVARQSG